MRAHWSSFVSKLFAGDLAAFGGPSPDETVAGFIRAEQVALVLRHTPGIMLANACNAAVLALALWNSPDAALGQIWAVAVICATAWTGIKARASWRIAKPQFVSRRAIHNVVRKSAVLGCTWAVVPVAFFADASNGGQLVITCLCAGMLAGGAFAFATIPVAAIGFMVPILIGTAICIGKIGDYTYVLVAVLVVVYTCVLLRGVFDYSFEFSNSLIRQLAAEKAVREDLLTHLPNRFAFNESLEACLLQLSLSGEPFAIFLLDLDRFKEVNDQFGHFVGDEFLIQVAARLHRCAKDTDVVARIGGDEFALIAKKLANSEDALAVAERIAASFAQPFLVEQHEIAGGASIGIVLAPRDGTTSSELLKHVDVALYRSKKIGPGTIRFFEPSDDVSVRERRALQRDLEGAIDRGELFLLYQPFFDLAKNRVTGFEALLRWRHPQRGLLDPSVFVPIAEESGLIYSIGEWVIRSACMTLAKWPADVRIAVNFSAVQFYNAHVLTTVTRALADHGVSPQRLEIEMTELMLISKYSSTRAVLDLLLHLGVTIALDDFGTGFSSLIYLRKLPFSRIKIDRSFIHDMLVQPDLAAIVKSVITLARDLKIAVVAEGVETREQLDYLSQTSCDEVQGFLIGEPVAFDQASAMLRDGKGAANHAA